MSPTKPNASDWLGRPKWLDHASTPVLHVHRPRRSADNCMTETDGPASETAVRHPGSTSAGQKCAEPIGKASCWRATFKNTAKKLVRDRVSMSAGSLAYHWFMSMFPAVIAILGLLALVHIDAHGVTSLTHATEKALPSGVAGVFSSAVKAATNRESGSVVAVIIGLVVSIWSASAGMSALQQALDVAYEVPVDRKFFARWGRSLPLMAATLVLGGSGAALVVLGAPIGAGIDGHVPLHGAVFLVVWTIVRWSISLIAISGLFSIFYYAGPNRHAPKVQWVSVGGVLATGAFTLASLGLVLCDEVQFIREDLRYLCRRCYPHLLALSHWVSGARWWRDQCGTRAPSSRSK